MTDTLDLEVIEHKDGKMVAMNYYKHVDRKLIHTILDLLHEHSTKDKV